jgi:hypothetical protein
MPNTTWPSIRAKRFRLTKLDECGIPVIGPKSTMSIKSFVKAGLSPEYEDGEDTFLKDGNGDPDVRDTGKPVLKNVGVEIEFIRISPEAWNLITGMPLAVDYAGNAVGVTLGQIIETNFALEVWSDVPGTACTGGAKPYGYFLLPFVSSGKLGEVSIEEAAATFTLSATTKDGAGWGAGPYDVDLNEAADEEDPPVPGPLVTPLTGTDHFRIQQVLLPPPAVTAGAVPLAA